ncbi:MAG: hypothetical protein KDA89_14015 [Planctomycetaceae bacterium]|nr:hypothetical protein [Planctomycetaceae bacterium]
MTSTEVIWYVFMAAGVLLALGNWRAAVYAGLLVDVLRDPVRKLIPMQPVLITLSGAALWLVIVLSAVLQERSDLRAMFRSYGRLRTSWHLLLIALLPAAGVSVISYQRGWIMASIGAASYLIPALGIAAGFAVARKPDAVVSILRFYVVVNAVMLFGVILEYLNADIPGLGGIDMVWIRYRPGYIVNLMSGWYRSPDIMGLHAAHVIMFSLLLAVVEKDARRGVWLGPAVWAAVCILLSGRRKMIGIPLIFLSVYLLLGLLLRVTRISRLAGVFLLSVLISGAVLLFVWVPDEASNYTEYAASLFTEGGGRANDLILVGTIYTLKQSGIIGAGLGTATQGRYYANIGTGEYGGWQEDGISRLFLEFGLPGVLLLSCALIVLLSTLLGCLNRLPPKSRLILLQLGLFGVVVGNAASYAISHQQFSGDPVNALMVTMVVGMVLRLPLQRSDSRTSLNTDVSTVDPEISGVNSKLTTAAGSPG